MKNNHSFKFNSPDIPRNFPPQSNILFHPTSYHSISHRTIQPISQAPPPSNFRATRQVRESLIGARARNIFVLSSSHNSSNDRDRKIRKQKKKKRQRSRGKEGGRKMVPGRGKIPRCLQERAWKETFRPVNRDAYVWVVY